MPENIECTNCGHNYDTDKHENCPKCTHNESDNQLVVGEDEEN